MRPSARTNSRLAWCARRRSTGTPFGIGSSMFGSGGERRRLSAHTDHKHEPGGGAALLVSRHALKPGAGARGESLWPVELGRKVQGYHRRDVRLRQMLGEI